MKLYSDFSGRRTWQIVGDVCALLAIAAWIWLGVTVYQLVDNLTRFGVQMEDAGAGFKQNMVELGETLGAIPLIGGGIRAPFDGASGAGAALESAGQSQQVAVQQLASGLGWGIAVLPTLTILLLWLLPRLRFARRAGRAQQLVTDGVGIDLLALRALMNRQLPELSAVDSDAMAAWRRGDEAVMHALAALELKASGVRLGDRS